MGIFINMIQDIIAPQGIDPNDYDTQEEYEEALEKQQKKAENAGSNTLSSQSGKVGSSNLKDAYKSNTGYDNFKKYFDDLSPNIVQDCLNSFDSKADLDMQKVIAQKVFGSGKATANINELQGLLAGTGITVSTEYVQAQYRIDEFAVGGQGKVTNGAITVMTFKDANGGEIKIADANGNAALETDELFMNEILGGITADIGNMGNDFAIDAAEGASNEQGEQEDPILKYFESKLQRREEKGLDINELTSKEIESVKEDLIEDLCKELMKENPNLSESEAKSLAESSAESAISKKYTRQDNGTYKLNSLYV